MVSISVAVAIMMVVLFSYSKFDNDLALVGASQEVAVAIREAQVYGLSVKERTAGGGNFNIGYGIYFHPSDPTNYYVFADEDNDGKYDGDSTCSTASECIEKGTLRNGIKISSVCGVTGGTTRCYPSSCIDGMAVTFLRPNPDASVNLINGGGNFCGSTEDTGQIILSSPQGKTLTISISKAGQISVQ